MAGLKTFLKAQLSAFAGSIFDYGVMLLLTECLGVYYVISTAAGAISGAIVNFTINRYWAFQATKRSAISQLPKFALVVLGSIVLKTAGTFAVTEYIGLDYRISRVTVDILVAIGFNFVLQRWWVFKT